MTGPGNRASDSKRAGEPFTIEIHPDALATIFEEVRIAGTELETGGILLGHNHHGRCTILVAGDPGPNAVRQPRAFSRDRAHAEDLADAAWAAHKANWVGEWHTHPEGLTTPSDIDLASYLAHLNDPELGFEDFISLIVALEPAERDPHLNECGSDSGSRKAVMTGWVIGPGSVEPARITTEQETQ